MTTFTEKQLAIRDNLILGGWTELSNTTGPVMYLRKIGEKDVMRVFPDGEVSIGPLMTTFTEGT